MTPILDLRKAPHKRWAPVIHAQREQWKSAEAALSADLTVPLKCAALARSVLFPAALKAEIASAAAGGLCHSFLRAAQVLYDESWASCRATPSCGCTSVSSDRGFGRNLDWGYPDNAAELVTRFTVVDSCGKEYLAEGFAGLFGWLAIAGEDRSASLNQAPCLRRLDRTAVPALWWFRHLLEAELPALGLSQLRGGPSADVLLHVEVGNQRYLAETLDQYVRVGRCLGKAVQANTYQLWDCLAGAEWQADSEQRMAAARAARGIPASLQAAAVDGWTVDQFVMRGAAISALPVP